MEFPLEMVEFWTAHRWRLTVGNPPMSNLQLDVLKNENQWESETYDRGSEK